MAARFWVGGAGTWDGTSTTNWSATSGGASGATAPTTADTVTFDSLSGTGTVSMAATATCSSATLNSSNITVQLTGSPTITGTMTVTLGTLNLQSNTLTCGVISSNNSNTRTLAFGTGKIIATSSGATIIQLATLTGLVLTGTPLIECNYSGSAGTRIIAIGNTAGGSEALAISVSVTAGTDIVTINGTSHIKNLNFTGFSGTLTNNGRTVYGSLTVSTGMTWTAGAAAMTFAATSGTQTITTNGKTLDQPLAVNAPGATVAFADALAQGSTRAFTFTAGTLKLKNGVTSTVGAFATSGTTAKTLQSASAGAVATLSQASGTVNASYLTVQDIVATGGAVWNAFLTNNNFDNGGNSGWNFGLSPGNTVEFSPALRSFTERKHF